ncbi:hypothetical protein Tco_0658842 [Tanacetum coccineum]
MFIVMVLDSWVCCFCNIDGFGLWMNMGVREMVRPQRFRVMPLMDVSFPYCEVTRLLSLVMPLLDALNFNHCDGKLQCLNCTDIMECSDSISFIQCLVFAADVDFGDIDFYNFSLGFDRCAGLHFHSRFCDCQSIQNAGANLLSKFFPNTKLNMGGGDGFNAEGDEDDSDTEEEVKEEEAIGKQEVAPPVSNQVEAAT